MSVLPGGTGDGTVMDTALQTPENPMGGCRGAPTGAAHPIPWQQPHRKGHHGGFKDKDLDLVGKQVWSAAAGWLW